MQQRLHDADEHLKQLSAAQAQLAGLSSENAQLKAELGETRHAKDHSLAESDTLRRDLMDAHRVRTEVEERATHLLSEISELRNKSDNLDNLHQVRIFFRSIFAPFWRGFFVIFLSSYFCCSKWLI